MRRLCLFCGSGAGARPAYLDAARALGRLLAERGVGLVYGGASVGLMGAAADAALAAGGEVIGVIPHGLVAREVAHPSLTTLHVVATLHERKARMAELADAFVALPGGLGTLEELFEVWTWGQLGVHRKPVALLDAAGYYRPLLDFLAHAAAEGFVRPAHLDALVVAAEPAALLDRLAAHAPPPTGPRWVTAAER